MDQSEVRPFEHTCSGEASVCGFLHLSASISDGLVLTHGAGANCSSPFLVALSEALCEAGVTVLRCDLPFRQLRPSGPPPRGSAERDQEGLRCAVEALRQQVPGRIFLGGHSYGGRQASVLAASQPELPDGLLLLSYPLHPPKKPEQARTAHLPNLRTPALFIHGSRDGFGSFEEMIEALKMIPSRTELLKIDHAGHELASARTIQNVTSTITEGFLKFFAL